MDKDTEKTVKETIEELLKLLEVNSTFTLQLADDVAEVVLETEESGIIIGYHGEMLESLQLILSLIISKKIGRFIRVSLEVGDYKKNRTLWLENLTFQTKQRALEEGREIPLSHLKSWERRIVHMFLQDDKEVTTESVGEGRERTLVIKPR